MTSLSDFVRTAKDTLGDLVRSVGVKDVALASVGAVASFALLERLRLNAKRKHLPGPHSTPPFLGTIVDMVKRPFHYYSQQQAYGPLSWNCLLGQFVVFVADAALSKRVFQNCSGGSNDYKLSMTLGGNRIFGNNNLIFMPQHVHKAVRRRFVSLFTRRALKVYLAIQERVVLRYLRVFTDPAKQPVVAREIARDMNIETSTEVFVGPYVTDHLRAEFAKHYFCMNEGFLALPLYFPGTTLWKAVKAKDTLVRLIEGFVGQSKARMAVPGATPHCLLDVWMEAELNRDLAAESEEDKMHRDNHSIACLLLDFLFAAQDASTSSIVWAVTLLCEHPDVLQKIREEQLRLRPENGPIDPDVSDQMIYTRQVTREILRFRPPATMVPHQTVRDTPITDDYSIPKGTIVLPSIWAAHFTDFENAQQFNPDRFRNDAAAAAAAVATADSGSGLSARKSTGEAYGSNFLAFGFGPHMCPGREYAMNHLTMFLALFSTNIEPRRVRTSVSDNIIFAPTIYPEDGCLVHATPYVPA